MENFVGQQIDRYRIIAQQGMGGMAVVYKAYDTRLERDVALKLIRAAAIPEEQHQRLMRRFEREAKAQARFTHRHIVPIYDYGEVNGSPYLVMAYIPGGTLKERTEKPVSYQQAIHWLVPIADALSYAHKRGVIHRDIKPSNILFDEEDLPILTDFGIAKILETDEATLTSTGLGVGTPEYMAPEQWQGKATDATDQYALGVVLYELLTGQKPYQADTPAGVAILQATKPLRSPSLLVPGIPGKVEKVLYKAMQNRPQDRFEDMAAFQKSLEDIVVVHYPDPLIPSENKQHIPLSNINSEEETYDVLEPVPVNIRQPSTNNKTSEQPKRARKKHATLPNWTVWSLSIVLLVSMVSLAISLIGNRNTDKPSSNPPSSTEQDMALVNMSVTDEVEPPTPTVTETIVPTSTPTLEPTPTNVPFLVNTVDGARMVYVPAGEFLMGSNDPDALVGEAPEHMVYLPDYWIYQFEVTNNEYRQCVEVGVCDEPKDTTYFDNLTYGNHPVVYVNWNDASTYCDWADGSLPTEAEWEKAAWGADDGLFPWGDQNPSCGFGNYAGCEGGTAAVGSYPRGTSPFGAQDMAGNVWEWVADWYDVGYYEWAPYDQPIGPDTGMFRVLRGGSWNNSSWTLRVTTRLKVNPELSNGNYGFRCVHDTVP